MIQQFEEISLNAWPALQTIHYDGWIIRFAEGVTKRSNSVNPIYNSSLEIESKIDFCEKLYYSRSLPACFKITEIVKPSDLDEILDARGYTHDFDVSVQMMNIEKLNDVVDENVEISETMDVKWLDGYVRMNERDLADKPVLKKIIEQIILPKGLLTFKINGQVIGCGLGVIEDKYIGLFDIVIDKEYRNQGFGKTMVENILKWGRGMGAEIGYLQVLKNNGSAIRLYEKVGFKEEYKYWYRIKKF